MRLIWIAPALTFWLGATFAQAAGLKSFEVPADAAGPAIQALMWTPCAGAPGEMKLGPFTLPDERDCPIAGDKLPLVVVSHGHGGNDLGHHDTAEALANAGFVVVTINHPGDTTSDMSHASDLSEFFERPTDIKRVIDFMLGTSPYSAKIDPARIGFFGFSRGGYTGLVIGGANPDFPHADVPCPDPRALICRQIAGNDIPSEPLVHDKRVKAIVIADPLSFFPTPESLKDVQVPLQLWGSERGGDGVLPDSVAAVARDLPAKPDFHRVPNSAHFAFLAPCPPKMAKAVPEICSDAPGFDRAAFHRQFDGEVLAFFQRHLTAARQP